ncbi:MAG: DEAD/DEAH box helicase [Methanomicrobiales archaeon]|nr:DEAD/DEAH box helicase [Methanomicrobiales archaeon]
MASVFSSLHESLQQVLADRLDWTELREVQERAYAAVAAGNDALILAPTAGGKSEAALIPVMDDILKHGRPGVACLYLSPLKALINDQEERFRAFCIPTSLSVMKWHGDVPKGDRSWKGEPPHFLMITPESLEVLLQERDLAGDLRQVRYIIIDELHAFVESERGVHLKVLLERMDRLAKRKIQRVGLSATTGNPEEILAWLSDGRQGAELVAVPAAPKEKHFRFLVEPEEDGRIDAIIRTVAGKKALVFVNSRSVAETIMQRASGRLPNLHIHHSSLAPATRKAAEESFLSGDGACIICTSTLELGIDIGDLDVVVQVGPPATVSSFLQRMGRSGRRGKAANVVWIVKNPCEFLCSAAIIECAMQRCVEALHPPEKPYNVLIQQVFLTLLRRQQVSRKELAHELLSYPVFSGIGEGDPVKILRHLAGEGYLTTDGEMLMPGTEAERVFGRSNWKDLYSVISGGGEFRAVTPEGDVVGKLDARFVTSRDGGEVTLGGRSWTMVKSDEAHDLVVVVPGGQGISRTFWTGSGEEGYSPLVCRQVRAICARGKSILPLSAEETELVATITSRLPPELKKPGLVVAERKGNRGTEVLIWSFCGSRFNRVLSHILTKMLGGRALVRYNDFLVRVHRAGKAGASGRIGEVLEKIRTMERPRLVSALPLPPRESWKFARVLPRDLFTALVAADYYHLDAFMDEFAGLDILVIPSGEIPKTR